MVDANNIGAGGVLMQRDKKGIKHPVCFFSHESFTPIRGNIPSS